MCHGKLNRCMYDPFNAFEGKLPGQSCEYGYQCLSKICEPKHFGQDGDEFVPLICAGAEAGTQCQADSECGQGLFCDSKECQAVRQEGGSCSRDEECSNSMACSNSKCVPYGSLSDYKPATNSLACVSGFTRELD